MVNLFLKFEECWLLILVITCGTIEAFGLSGCGKAVNFSSARGAVVEKSVTPVAGALVEISGIQIEHLSVDPPPLDLIMGNILLTKGFTIARDRYLNVSGQVLRLWVNAPVSTFILRSKLHTVILPGGNNLNFYRNYQAPVICDEIDFLRDSRTLKKITAGGADFFELKPGESIELSWKIHAPSNVRLCEFSLLFHDKIMDTPVIYSSNWLAVAIEGTLLSQLRLSSSDLQTFSVDQSSLLLSKSDLVHEAAGDWQTQPNEDSNSCSGLQPNDGSSGL